jgi:hypothetical protein
VAIIVCTSLRGGSISTISPSLSRISRLCGQVQPEPTAQSGLHAGAEVVLAPDLGIGDRLPEALGRRADVDLEHLLHGTLQSGLEVAEPCGPGLGVLAHPPVVDESDRDGVEEMELLAASPLGDHQARLLELLEVLHHPEAGHRKALDERVQRLAVLAVELVEEAAPSRIGEAHGRPRPHPAR